MTIENYLFIVACESKIMKCTCRPVKHINTSLNPTTLKNLLCKKFCRRLGIEEEIVDLIQHYPQHITLNLTLCISTSVHSQYKLVVFLPLSPLPPSLPPSITTDPQRPRWFSTHAYGPHLVDVTGSNTGSTVHSRDDVGRGEELNSISAIDY